MSNHTTLDAETGSPLGEISQAPPALEVFLDKHQMKLIVIAVILTILTAAYVVYSGIKQGGEETAGELLTKAVDSEDLQSVVKNHEGTAAANSAKILLAEKQWEEGLQDEAISTLRAFVENEGEHPARPSAEASLATKLASQGKADEAVELLKKLTEDSDSRYLAPFAWITLGDLEASKGNVEAAVKAYETVGRDFPGSSFSQEATLRSQVVKAKAPALVSAPITVPEVKLTGEDDEKAPAGDLEINDLIDAVKDGANETPSLPE
ncbi:tetratricopeptide repeat protein [Luteolibacter algae]|uniref:Tetratricopeptide repeat protein n=1 Tax=Luteolibacter algae TaxID=454151 RepID=A0ABW5D733_9BACT